MTDEVRGTLKPRVRWSLLLSLVAVIVAVDQWSKAYAVAHWRGRPMQSYFNDLFRIEYAENPGAFLSLLAGMPEAVRFWVLVVINGIVLAGVSVWLLSSRRVTLSLFIPFSLFIAGGIGNLIDRIRFGVVIDFFNLGVGSLRTGIFNVADMAITAGFLLMLPLLFRGEPTAEPDRAVDGSASSAQG
jgi:signal peptidase II